MLIKPLLIAALETAVNHTLSLDKNASQLLMPLAGKVIAITITPFAETVYLCPSNDSIQLMDAYPDTADTHLTGSLFALGLMGVSDKPMRSIFAGTVRIEGDMHTGRKFQQLFAKLDINLEAQLARYTGDALAQHISQFLRTGQQWSKETLITFQLNAAEFLQEETRDLPAAAEMEVFLQQIDDLRLDFDRLQSRLLRLEQRVNPSSLPQVMQ